MPILLSYIPQRDFVPLSPGASPAVLHPLEGCWCPSGCPQCPGAPHTLFCYPLGHPMPCPSVPRPLGHPMPCLAVTCPLLPQVPWGDLGAHPTFPIPWSTHALPRCPLSLEHPTMSPSPGTPVLPCLALGTHHSWKLAAWVESQKSMPITTLAVSPGARRSETTGLPLRPMFPLPANPSPHPPQQYCGCAAPCHTNLGELLDPHAGERFGLADP